MLPIPVPTNQSSVMPHDCYVYILSSSSKCLYVGVTRNVLRRWLQHRLNRGSEFCAKYRIRHLVYVERCSRPREAIAREKQLKRWRRDRKIALVTEANPNWDDLAVRWGWHRMNVIRSECGFPRASTATPLPGLE